MVVHGYGKSDFRIILFDNVLVHVFFNLFRCRKFKIGKPLLLLRSFHFFFQYIPANFNAFIADKDTRSRNQSFNFVSRPSAEVAYRWLFIFISHRASLFLA